MDTNNSKQSVKQLEDVLDLYLVKKAPALPANIKQVIVNFAPWLIIIGIIFSIPAVFALFGLGSMMSALPYGYAMGARFGLPYFLSIAFLVVIVVLEIMALPGLFSRSAKGWRFIFYSVLVSAVSSLVSFNLFGLVIGTLISLYLLFQVKEYYK